MSLFLGPIHFWLYGKIEKQEELTKQLSATAKAKGLIIDSEKYTYDLPDLESAIDTTNIHGWLQGKITEAETRYAQLVMDVIAKDPASVEVLEESAYEFGKKYSLDENTDCEGAFQFMENFFLNGMPCDHVVTVLESGPDKVKFVLSQDIHKTYWTWPEGTALYYKLRQAVMNGMISGSNLTLTEEGNLTYVIKSV